MNARRRCKDPTTTYCEKSAMSWSLVTVSGRFCKNRILFGGRYSSGIWTLGRFAAGTAPAPSTRRHLREAFWRSQERAHTIRSQTLLAVFPLDRVGVASCLCTKQACTVRTCTSQGNDIECTYSCGPISAACVRRSPPHPASSLPHPIVSSRTRFASKGNTSAPCKPSTTNHPLALQEKGTRTHHGLGV